MVANTPTLRALIPLFRVYTDVHGPLPTRSHRGSRYWVSLVDDFSLFPVVHFINRKPDVFGVLKRYKA